MANCQPALAPPDKPSLPQEGVEWFGERLQEFLATPPRGLVLSIDQEGQATVLSLDELKGLLSEVRALDQERIKGGADVP